MIDADRDAGDITKWRLSSEEPTGEWAGVRWIHRLPA
jgi:hypothetical protein